jgi:hypothetical protein
MNSYYGHEVTGIWQLTDDIANSAQPFAQPGYLKFKDQNGDGTINADDLVILGRPEPDLTFGLSNTFSYNNFDLTVFIYGAYGAELLSGNWIRSFYPVDYTRNRIAEPWRNRWTPDNPTNDFPSGIDYPSYGGSQVHTLTLQDASYLRIQNVQLSYTIPVQNIGFLRSARVDFFINNLATFTDYNGFNPEASRNTEDQVRAEMNTYPLARTYALGIALGF